MLDPTGNTTCDFQIQSEVRVRADLLWGTQPLTQLRGCRVQRLGAYKVNENLLVGVYRN